MASLSTMYLPAGRGAANEASSEDWLLKASSEDRLLALTNACRDFVPWAVTGLHGVHYRTPDEGTRPGTCH